MYKLNDDKLQKKKFSRDFEDADSLEYIWYVMVSINSLMNILIN